MFQENLSNVFDQVVPKSKDDVVRRREKQRVREMLMEQEQFSRSNEGYRNNFPDQRRNTDHQGSRLYNKDRNDNRNNQPGYPRRQSESFANMSDMLSFNDGKISRFSMLNDSRHSLAQPKQRFQHPENPDLIQSMVRDVISPRTMRAQPYVDARSPHNDKLRHDFYSGNYTKKFDAQNDPEQKKKDGKSYVDKMVTGRADELDDEAMKKQSTVTLATEKTGVVGFQSDIQKMNHLGIVKREDPQTQLKTPKEYKLMKHYDRQPQPKSKFPTKQFKEMDHLQMPRDLSNREIKKHMMRQRSNSREFSGSRHGQYYRKSNPPPNHFRSASQNHYNDSIEREEYNQYYRNPAHNTEYARRPQQFMKRSSPKRQSPIRKNYPKQWEPASANEDTFGIRNRNFTPDNSLSNNTFNRNNSRVGIINVEAVRQRSPEFFDNEKYHEDPYIRSKMQMRTDYKRDTQFSPYDYDKSLTGAKPVPKYDPLPQQVDSSYMEKSQILRASWADKPSKQASASFRTSNTFASSTLMNPPKPSLNNPRSKQSKYGVKGPKGLVHSKSQTFMPMQPKPNYMSEAKADPYQIERREPLNREEIDSRNSVIRISHLKNVPKTQPGTADRQRRSFVDNPFNNKDLRLEQQHVEQFKEEYEFVIQNAENMGRNLYLIDVLEQLDFIDEGILRVQNYEEQIDIYNQVKDNIIAQKADILIVSTKQESYITQDVQKNLFKILCAIQNLQANQSGSFRLSQALLDQHTERITHYRPNDEQNIIHQVVAIRNLINRQAFTMNDSQVAQLHNKFQNLSDYRLQRSPDGLERALSQGGPEQAGYPGYVSTPAQTPMESVKPSVYQKDQEMRKAHGISQKQMAPMRPMPNSTQALSKTAKDPFNRAYMDPRNSRPSASLRGGYPKPKAPRPYDNYDQFEEDQLTHSAAKQLVCSIRVQIDGNRSEFLNILEGDDPDLVVRKFAQRYNLTNKSTRSLMDQVKEQYY